MQRLPKIESLTVPVRWELYDLFYHGAPNYKYLSKAEVSWHIKVYLDLPFTHKFKNPNT